MAKLQSAIVKDFTVIHNEFVKDERLGIEEKGMLLLLMSLPEDWDFSIEGLTKISRSGKCKVSNALNKLKKYGYFRRIRQIDENGRVIDWIYEFSDQPHFEWLEENSEKTPQSDFRNVEEEPHSDFRDVENRDVDNHPQYNTYKYNTKELNKIDRREKNEKNIDLAKFLETKEKVKEQINEENELVVDGWATEEEVEEIIDIVTEVYLSHKKSFKVNGNNISSDNLRYQFGKLTSEHIKYYFSQIKKNKYKIFNMKKFIVASLYNAPMTLHNAITSDVARWTN
ncbi:MAG: hypothetical protein IKK32_06550 [Oscillospiraceae bacterium]|nr:hypothetical protein [Oscillospiraceae bacterium]